MPFENVLLLVSQCLLIVASEAGQWQEGGVLDVDGVQRQPRELPG